MSRSPASRFRILAAGLVRIASGERGAASLLRCPAMSANGRTARHVAAGHVRWRVPADPTAAFGLLL